MANDYFNASTSLTQHTLARSAQVNAIFQAVAAGLDKLPDADPLNQGRVTYVADTGAANAYVVTLPKAPSSYVAGLSVMMKATNANTGASTINVNGLGVKSIKTMGGADLQANQVLAGVVHHLVYDGSVFLLLSPTPSDAAVTALETFQGIFYGALASDPANDPNGDAPDQGDWYFNTTSNVSRQFDGTVWSDIGATRLTTFVFTASGGETSLSGVDDNGNTLSYTVNFVMFYINGVHLTPDDDYTASDGTSITGLAAMNSGDIAIVEAFSSINLSDALVQGDLSDNEVLAKVGSASPTGLPVSTNELVGRAGSDLATIPVPSNSLVARLGSNLTTLAVNASRIVGRAASGALKALTAQEVRDVAELATSAQIRTLLGHTWIRAAQVGNDLNITSMSIPALAALNGTDVAFIDSNNEDLRVYRFDGATWSQVGNDLNITGVTNPALTALNGTDVAFIDSNNDDLRVYRFDGTDWSQIGNGLSVNTGDPALAALNGTDVAFFDTINLDLRVYRFDGTDWSQVGNDLNIGGFATPALTALNGTDVAFVDSTNNLQVYRFDGTDWAQVGNDFSVTVSGPALAALNGTDIAFIGQAGDDLRVYRFDGTDWSQIGNDLNIATVSDPALAALNGTDVAFIGTGNDDLRVYRFAFALGKPPAPPFS